MIRWLRSRRVKRHLTLADTLKPCPEYRRRRLAQMSPERVQRYLRATEGLR